MLIQHTYTKDPIEIFNTISNRLQLTCLHFELDLKRGIKVKNGLGMQIKTNPPRCINFSRYHRSLRQVQNESIKMALISMEIHIMFSKAKSQGMFITYLGS